MLDPAFVFDHAGHTIEVKLNGEWWDGEIYDADSALLDAFSYIHEGDYPGDLRAALNYADRDGLAQELWLQVWRRNRDLEDAPSVSVELSGDIIAVRRYQPSDVWVGEIRTSLIRYLHAPLKADTKVETDAFPDSARTMLATRLWDAVVAQAESSKQ